jgi:uncharacterized protein (TIGR00251 family)
MALIIEVKVVPSAGRNQWKLEPNNRLKYYVKSAPEKGKANNELIMLLAKSLNLPSSAITILSGATSRLKRVKIDAPIAFETLLKKLDIEQQLPLFKGK